MLAKIVQLCSKTRERIRKHDVSVHPVSRVGRLLAAQQKAAQEQWLADLKFAAVDAAAIDHRHWTRLELCNNLTAQIVAEFPELADAFPKHLDLTEVERVIHSKLGSKGDKPLKRVEQIS